MLSFAFVRFRSTKSLDAAQSHTLERKEAKGRDAHKNGALSALWLPVRDNQNSEGDAAESAPRFATRRFKASERERRFTGERFGGSTNLKSQWTFEAICLRHIPFARFCSRSRAWGESLWGEPVRSACEQDEWIWIKRLSTIGETEKYLRRQVRASKSVREAWQCSEWRSLIKRPGMKRAKDEGILRWRSGNFSGRAQVVAMSEWTEFDDALNVCTHWITLRRYYFWGKHWLSALSSTYLQLIRGYCLAVTV